MALKAGAVIYFREGEKEQITLITDDADQVAADFKNYIENDSPTFIELQSIGTSPRNAVIRLSSVMAIEFLPPV